MKAEGIDVLDFSVGEPDFPTPLSAKEAGARSKGTSPATPPTKARRAAPGDRHEAAARDNGLTYGTDAILVSPGAKASIFCASMALFAGDEVLMPTPYWVSYPEQIRLAGATPVPLRARPTGLGSRRRSCPRRSRRARVV
jgi:aspartate aminotransferase